MASDIKIHVQVKSSPRFLIDVHNDGRFGIFHCVVGKSVLFPYSTAVNTVSTHALDCKFSHTKKIFSSLWSSTL